MQIIGYVNSEAAIVLCDICGEGESQQEFTPIYCFQEEATAGWCCDECGEIVGDMPEDYGHKEKCELCQHCGVDSNATDQRLLVGEYTRSVSLRPVCDNCAENLDNDRVTVAECLECHREIPYYLLSQKSSFHDMSCIHYCTDNNQ